ncbi:MAG TPA: hypothetical protein DIW47_16295 [Bacteroidetes bacterium]|nr:hypothetical protein [Bacteroidota bacterium]
MNATNIQDFSTLLQRLWSIENLLVEAMPGMIEKASNLGLQKSLAHHFEETRQHKVAIEAICKQLGIDPTGGEPDMGLQEILKQGDKELSKGSAETSGEEIDAILINNALQVEQYEMDAYMPAGDAAEFAGFEGVSQRLRLTLAEERQADTKLRFLLKSLYSPTAEIGQMGN